MVHKIGKPYVGTPHVRFDERESVKLELGPTLYTKGEVLTEHKRRMGHNRIFTLLGLWLCMTASQIVLAGQISLGTSGGTHTYSGKITESDRNGTSGIYNINASTYMGYMGSTYANTEILSSLSTSFIDNYTFTAKETGVAKLTNFTTSHPKGDGAVSIRFQTLNTIEGILAGDQYQRSMTVTAGRQYQLQVYAGKCLNQTYSFTIQIPGSNSNGTTNDGGNNTNINGTTPASKNHVNITFNANGGTLSRAFGDYANLGGSYTLSLASGELYPWNSTMPRVNARIGYEFLGWFTSKTGGTAVTTSSRVPSSSTTLYAHWGKYVYVTFDANGGTGSGSQSFVAGETKNLSKNGSTFSVRKTGHSFKGWSMLRTGNVQYADGAKFSTTANTTLYAVWVASDVAITFDENWNGGGKSTRNYAAMSAYGNFPVDPVREGYTFAGWWTMPSTGERVSTSSSVPYYDKTLYAHWTKACKIVYDANGGDGYMAHQTFTAGEDFCLNRNRSISRNGYVFRGWSKTNYGDVEYEDGAELTADGDMTLYAVWEASLVSIVFDDNWSGGGTIAMENHSGQVYDNFASDPYSYGYVFKGWYTSPIGGDLVTQYSIVPSYDMTLYAHWEEIKTYTASYWFNADGTAPLEYGGDTHELRQYTAYEGGTAYFETLPVPTRAGCIFDGWYTAEVGGTRITEYSPAIENAHEDTWTDLYAHWVHVPNEEGTFILNGAMYDYLGSCDMPLKISGMGRAERRNLSMPYSVSFSPSTSGEFQVAFRADNRIEDHISLGLSLTSENDEQLGRIDVMGSFSAYFQAGRTYKIRFYEVLSPSAGSAPYSRDCAYDIQIGGNEPHFTIIDAPEAPECIVTDDKMGIRLAWKPVTGATKYYVQRSTDAYKYGGMVKAGGANFRTIAEVDASNADAYLSDGRMTFTDSPISVYPFEYCIIAATESTVSTQSGYTKCQTKREFSASGAEWDDEECTKGRVMLGCNDTWVAVSDSEWLSISNVYRAINYYDLSYLSASYEWHQGSEEIIFTAPQNDSGSARIANIGIAYYIDGGVCETNLLCAVTQKVDTTISVSLKSDGDSLATGIATKSGSSYGGLPEVEKTGYSFNGWVDQNGDSITGDARTGSSDVTLDAQWTVNHYNIRFNPNGGVGTMSDLELTYDMVTSLPKCQFSREGFVFLGWATLAGSEYVEYEDGTEVENISDVDGAVVIFYAVWGAEEDCFGLWGYKPNERFATKDDVEESVLGNVVFTLNNEPMAEGDVVGAYDQNGFLRSVGRVVRIGGKLNLSLSMHVAVGTRLMFLLWKNGTQVSDTCIADTWIVAPAPGTVDNAELRLVGASDNKVPFPSCEISLAKSGWHLVSFSALPDDPSPANVFADVVDKIDRVVQGSRVWRPATGGRLTELKIGIGYWVRTSVDNVSWTIVGLSNPGVEISLSKGWNLVGYPLAESGATATVLKSAFDSGKVERVVDGTKVYPGRLERLVPGKGYWFYAPAACTIMFDGN